MVIISIAAVALLQGLGLQSQRNVDPMIQSQAQRLAIQYLQEVSNKPFFDPSADPRLNPNLTSVPQRPSVIASIENGAGRIASPNRLAWDNIYEYNGYIDSIKDISGSAIEALAGYRVKIDVDIATDMALGPNMKNSANAGCPAKIAKISVTVTDPRNQETTLSAFRTSYWDPGC
jgi:hypothetical protein